MTTFFLPEKDQISNFCEKKDEFSSESQLLHLEARISLWLDQEKIFMMEPGYQKLVIKRENEPKPQLKLASKLYLLRKKS